LRFDLFREIERNLLTDIEIQGLKSCVQLEKDWCLLLSWYKSSKWSSWKYPLQN